MYELVGAKVIVISNNVSLRTIKIDINTKEHPFLIVRNNTATGVSSGLYPFQPSSQHLWTRLIQSTQPDGVAVPLSVGEKEVYSTSPKYS